MLKSAVNVLLIDKKACTNLKISIWHGTFFFNLKYSFKKIMLT